MRWLDHRDAVPDSLRGAIVALGNFDGFHRGHQAVAGEAIKWAREEGRPSIVATFDPHPVRFFKPDAEPFRLTTLEQRQELYLEAGATAMLVLHFDGTLASTTAEDFIGDLLAKHLGVSGVVTGEDFTFGKARGGLFVAPQFAKRRTKKVLDKSIARIAHGKSARSAHQCLISFMLEQEYELVNVSAGSLDA